MSISFSRTRVAMGDLQTGGGNVPHANPHAPKWGEEGLRNPFHIMRTQDMIIYLTLFFLFSEGGPGVGEFHDLWTLLLSMM